MNPNFSFVQTARQGLGFRRIGNPISFLLSTSGDFLKIESRGPRRWVNNGGECDDHGARLTGFKSKQGHGRGTCREIASTSPKGDRNTSGDCVSPSFIVIHERLTAIKGLPADGWLLYSVEGERLKVLDGTSPHTKVQDQKNLNGIISVGSLPSQASEPQ